MFDWLADFFQGIYDSTIGYILDMWSSFTAFISTAWDIILILAIVGMAIALFKIFGKYLVIPAAILFELLVSAFLISTMMTFVVIFSTMLVSAYNHIIELAAFLSTSSGASCVFSMFGCLGINGILSTFYTELFALLIIALTIKLFSLFLWAFEFLLSRFYKITSLLAKL